jgi:hypothetical protein
MTLNIRPHLLWEYNFATFDFQNGAAIVVERVINRGNMEDWKALTAHYSKEKIIELANLSKQLSERDERFAALFIYSGFLS